MFRVILAKAKEKRGPEAVSIVGEVDRAPGPGEGGSLRAEVVGAVVRGPGEAELRGLETLSRRRGKTQMYFRVSSQGNYQGKSPLHSGRGGKKEQV